MWMTEFIREVKKQLRDEHGFKPTGIVGGELIFAPGVIPDGIYPVTIEGKLCQVELRGGKFYLE